MHDDRLRYQTPMLRSRARNGRASVFRRGFCEEREPRERGRKKNSWDLTFFFFFAIAILISTSRVFEGLVNNLKRIFYVREREEKKRNPA